MRMIECSTVSPKTLKRRSKQHRHEPKIKKGSAEKMKHEQKRLRVSSSAARVCSEPNIPELEGGRQAKHNAKKNAGE